MATYPKPVLYFADFAGAKAALDDQGQPYLGMLRRGTWGFFPWVILNNGGANDQSLRVINVVGDPNAQPPVADVLAAGWFCGVAKDPSEIPATLSQSLSDGAAAVAAAAVVEPVPA